MWVIASLWKVCPLSHTHTVTQTSASQVGRPSHITAPAKMLSTHTDQMFLHSFTWSNSLYNQQASVFSVAAHLWQPHVNPLCILSDRIMKFVCFYRAVIYKEGVRELRIRISCFMQTVLIVGFCPVQIIIHTHNLCVNVKSQSRQMVARCSLNPWVGQPIGNKVVCLRAVTMALASSTL